jgi:hypothetical protein
MTRPPDRHEAELVRRPWYPMLVQLQSAPISPPRRKSQEKQNLPPARAPINLRLRTEETSVQAYGFRFALKVGDTSAT